MSIQTQEPPDKVVTETARPSTRRKSQSRWSRPAVNFLLDSALLLTFLGVLWLALLRRFVFPPPTQSAGWLLWGLNCDAWGRLHFIAIAALAVLVLVHLLLHWTWILGFVTSRIRGRTGARGRVHQSAKTLYGVTTLITVLTLLGLLLLWAELSVQSPQ
ncbi:MAG: DUF4405 domain-containing protein [Phycisphaerae bacterium]